MIHLQRPLSVRWIVVAGSLCLALLFGLLGGQAMNERHALWQLQLNKQSSAQHLAWQSVHSSMRERALLLAQTIADDTHLGALLLQAGSVPASETERLNEIRRQLYDFLAPRWRRLQPHQPFQLRLSLPGEAGIFLRLHAPERFGDRPQAMERDVLQGAGSLAGFQLEDDQLLIRAVAPVTGSDLQPAGSVSVTLNLLDELPRLDQNLASGIALLRSSASQDEPPASADWQIISQSRPQAQHWLDTGKLLTTGTFDSPLLLNDNGHHFLLSHLLLSEDDNGRAGILIWRDICELYSLHRKKDYWLMGKWLLAWIGAEAMLLILLLATRRSTQRLMQRQQSALRALNEISALTGLSSQEQLRRALRIGADYFHLPHGLISLLEGKQYRVQVSTDSALQDGQPLALDESFCDLTLQGNELLAIEHVAVSPWKDHPARTRSEVASYIGIPVRIGEHQSAILSFFGPQPRQQSFNANEREFVHLFARWVGAILERRKQEQARQNLLQRLASIIEGTNVGTWEWNVQSGAMVFNERWAQMLGYQLEELQPTSIDTWRRLCHPQDLVASERLLQRHFAGKVTHYSKQVRLRHRDGHWVWVQIRGSLSQRDEQGRPLLMYGTNTDISEARERENAIVEARTFLQTVLNSATGVSIIATDLEGRITLFNSGAERLLGYRSEEVVGRLTPDAFHCPEEIAARAERLRRSTGLTLTGIELFSYGTHNGEPETGQWTYLHKDGSRRLVNLTTNAIFDAEGQITGFLGIASDISALHQTTLALQHSESRFRGLVANLPGVVYRCANDQHWSMSYISDGILSLSGYPPSDFIDNRVRSFASVIHPDDRQLSASINACIERQGVFERTYRIQHADGHSVWVREKGRAEYDAEGQVLWLDGFIWDISERKVMEDELRESEHYLRTLLDNVIDAIITFDEKGHIETFNRAAERIFGHRQADVAGHSVACLLAEPATVLPLPRQITGQTRELEGLRSNGERFPAEVAVSHISHQGQARFIVVIRDIAERKRIERMKSEFVATVSHELRTPLTAIAGSLGLINGGVLGEVPPTMRQMLDIAQANSQRLSELINDLLDMEKLVAGKMHFELHSRNLGPLLEQALLHNQPYADQHQVRLKLEIISDLPVRVDAQRLAQVMANLLSNAAKFSPPGSTVQVRLETCGRQQRVSVQDQGPGIPLEFQSRLFGKFSQADSGDARQRGGTGLGLAICKEIVERMDGEIGFLSPPGEGATFWFQLPVDEAAPC
ncbi:PAS domain S-box protein [Pseudomonas sp. NCCP-436]|uniref:PAS domain S-box protein n=1 Tax=Pseudomonas sp. NCCP-436 TaxID=2842481 RepID=UPI001D585443|nr:PAS domain S-box protein [Pseudomonas sp. NCCP-436]GIZ12440.1 hypothetical protein NCCP436_18560 [Pseudomonas sp. NCCP-436]